MGYEAVNIGLEFIKGTDHRGVCMIKQNKLGFKQTFVNPLSANFTKQSNTLKQFVGNLPTNYLSVFDHFVGLALNRLRNISCSLVWWLAPLHSFIQQKAKLGSAQVEILLAMCWRFVMMRTSGLTHFQLMFELRRNQVVGF